VGRAKSQWKASKISGVISMQPEYYAISTIQANNFGCKLRTITLPSDAPRYQILR